MSTLFISYRHGTDVSVVKGVLYERGYRVWHDDDQIFVGDVLPKEIELGLQACSALILCLTTNVCESIWVKREVTRVLELGKRIFPLILEKGMTSTSVRHCLYDLGIHEEIVWLDYISTDTTDDTKKHRLFAALDKHGIRVSPHNERERLSLDNSKYQIRQAYLRRIVERIGTINLTQIISDQPQINLEDIYVGLPTSLTISVKVEANRITDWWISRRQTDAPGYKLPGLERYLQDIENQFRKDGAFSRKNTERESIYSDIFSLKVQDFVAAHQRVVVVGFPGSGKGTFVKYLALCLAGSQIDGWTRPATIDQLGNWTHGKLTPVYVELRRFAASEFFPRNENTPTVEHLWRYIQTDLLQNELAAYAGELQYDLTHGHALLILDGLDEVPIPDTGIGLQTRKEQLQALVHSIVHTYSGSRVVIASRSYAYENWSLPSFERVEIADLGDGDRRQLILKLYSIGALSLKDAEQKTEALNVELEKRAIHPDLKNRPLFLTQMAALFIQNGLKELPSRRGSLYHRIILLLLETWTKSKTDTKSLSDLLGTEDYKTRLDDLIKRVAALAYDIQANYVDKPELPEIGEDLAYKYLLPMGRVLAVDIIKYLSDNAGLLECPGRDSGRNVVRFAHWTFQEYLAAVHLVSICRDSDSFLPLRSHIERNPAQWREPGALIGDMLTAEKRRRDLWNVIDDLLDDEISDLDAADPRWWSVWLSARIFQEQELYTRPVQNLKLGSRQVHQSLTSWLVKLIQTPNALNPPERALCGRSLSLLGDPRKGVTPISVDEDFVDWCEVPGNKFIFGERENQQIIKLDYDYWISKYPITYAQYKAFYDDDGYKNDDYWTDAGLKWKDNKENPEICWGEPHWDIANHPVVGVTWFEAVAFCKWLSKKLGYDVSLPSEAEWEKAARGTDGRLYPYSGDFDLRKGNTGGSSIGRTSAVGLFPDGASPYGVCDMSGNVYDWCMSKWHSSYVIEEDNSIEGVSNRVVRGGSMFSSPSTARVTYRDGKPPQGRYIRLGFRIMSRFK